MIAITTTAVVRARASACRPTRRSPARATGPCRTGGRRLRRLRRVLRRRRRSGFPERRSDQLAVVAVRQLGGQRPQLGGPTAEASEPAADGGSRQAQRGRDATVTQVLSPWPGAPRRRSRRDRGGGAAWRWAPGRASPGTPGTASGGSVGAGGSLGSAARARARTPRAEHPVVHDGHRRRPSRSRASTRAGASATASTPNDRYGAMKRALREARQELGRWPGALEWERSGRTAPATPAPFDRPPGWSLACRVLPLALEGQASMSIVELPHESHDVVA